MRKKPHRRPRAAGRRRSLRSALALGGAVPGAFALLLVASDSGLAQEPRATTAEPAVVQVRGTNTAAEVLLRGSAFEAIRSVAVTDARGRSIDGTAVRIVQRGPDWLRIVISTDERALDRTTGFLTLVTTDARVTSRIEVHIGTAPFVPVTLTASSLAMTGIRFKPVTVDASGLVMTGIRFKPVTVDASGLLMTGLGTEPTGAAPAVRQTSKKERKR